MRKTNRKGFTIVELVIVIAVIAVLAAVLIPTFASLVSKANLSADMQAVRAMNLALESHEKLHGKCETLEDAMKVLANAGYNTKNWACLTTGYQVYWYATDNRCVLYNSTTAQIEFPKDFESSLFASDAANFKLYNQNFYDAINQDFSFSSGSATTNKDGVTLGSASADGKYEIELGSDGSKVELNKDALGSISSKPEDVKLFAYNENKTNTTGAQAFVKSYGAYEGTPELTSSGAVKPNLFVIGTSIQEGATAEQKLEAEKAAGTYVYSLMVQMSTGSVDTEASLYIEPGTTLNLSAQEWCGYSLFSGYFGTTDDANPIVIDGMKLTSYTGYANTYRFSGSNSTYYMTGFFGALTGTATVENVKFTNVTIEDPASDFANLSPKSNDSNCTSILGGVIATPDDSICNIKIRNVEITDTCSVKGVSRVGGLLAYVGGYQGLDANSKKTNYGLGGTIEIEGCKVACDVTTSKETAYGSAGGIIGFINKTYNSTVSSALNISIKNTSYSGSVFGYQVGGIIGYYSPSTSGTNGNVSLTLDGVDASAATLTINPAVAGSGFKGQILGSAYVSATSGNDNLKLTVTNAKYLADGAAQTVSFTEADLTITGADNKPAANPAYVAEGFIVGKRS